MTEATFILSSHASNFVTRSVGRLLRDKLLEFERGVPPEARITIDTSGISLITPSFVDEFFGRTAALFGIERFRSRFRIVGTEDDTKLLINNVVRNRLILQQQEASKAAEVGKQE